VTRVDHEALLRSRAPVQKSRGLIGWLSGEYVAPAAPIPPETLAPPAAEVRREMLRLELAALEAEAQARRAELMAERADAGLTLPDDAVAPESEGIEPDGSSEPEAPADT
jgi:hypothetical protein